MPTDAAVVEHLYSEHALSKAGGGARATIRRLILEGRLPALIVLEAGGKRRFVIPADAAHALIARRAKTRSAA